MLWPIRPLHSLAAFKNSLGKHSFAVSFSLLAFVIGLHCWQRVTAQSGRSIRVVSGAAQPGQTIVVPLELVAQGDENALGFSLNFNPAQLS
ncbi:MAG: hypothetical protein HOP19_15780, partial [Acidobacteria bacterium]|nr:hypothetical protein [Acidobacteriota bacterium]